MARQVMQKQVRLFFWIKSKKKKVKCALKEERNLKGSKQSQNKAK